MQSIIHDLRFAMRQLRKSPGFACTTVLVLSLGICASVAIFAYVDAALIRPLPYANPNQLVGAFLTDPLGSRNRLSYPDYIDWKRLNRSFVSLDAYSPVSFMQSTPTGAQPADGACVSDGFFRTLGVSPVLGRDFLPGEDLAAAPRNVLISYGAWRKRYGGKDVLGQTVTLDGLPHTIIGVLPQVFHFAPVGPADFWTTLHAPPTIRRGFGGGLHGIARLKEGFSLQTASTEMTAIAKQLAIKYPDTNRDQSVLLLPLTDVIVGDIRPILMALLSGAGLLLLIAGVNVASLLLARSESRIREIAVRSALGASPARLLRQFVTEALVLVTAGGVVGVTFAQLAMRFLIRLVPRDILAGMPYLHGVGLNVHGVVFTFCVSLIAGLLFSLTPSLRVSFSRLHEGLVEGGRTASGRMWRRFGANLVVIELAIAVVLLVGAGLLIKSLYRLLHTDTGIQPEHLAVLQVGTSDFANVKNEQAIALEKQVLGRIANLPGVTAVGIANKAPAGDGDGTREIRVLGRPFHGEHNDVLHRVVSPAYFAALKASLVRGRFFTEADDTSKPRVAIINQALARTYFSGEDPIGQRITHTDDLPQFQQSPMEIVGLVSDIQEGPLDMVVRPAMYVPFDQNPQSWFAVVVRTTQAEESLLPSLAAAIHEIDPGIETYGEATMSERMRDSPSAYLHRSAAWLAGSFAVLALLLGVVGLYGVIAYSVSKRTREIGIRMALGARRGLVCQLILKEAAWLTGMGIAGGLVCAVAAAALMRRLLFGVQSWDAGTLISVSVLLAMLALLASYLPARWAANVEPMEALRYE